MHLATLVLFLTANTPYWEENRLILQLVKGGPQEKMAAAKRLEQMRSKKAVPYLLLEARDRYPKIIYEPGDNPHLPRAYVFQDGKKVPYVDYHEPLFSALSRIAVPYFEPDKDWFEAIDEWIKANLPKPKQE